MVLNWTFTRYFQQICALIFQQYLKIILIFNNFFRSYPYNEIGAFSSPPSYFNPQITDLNQELVADSTTYDVKQTNMEAMQTSMDSFSDSVAVSSIFNPGRSFIFVLICITNTQFVFICIPDNIFVFIFISVTLFAFIYIQYTKFVVFICQSDTIIVFMLC